MEAWQTRRNDVSYTPQVYGKEIASWNRELVLKASTAVIECPQPYRHTSKELYILQSRLVLLNTFSLYPTKWSLDVLKSVWLLNYCSWQVCNG